MPLVAPPLLGGIAEAEDWATSSRGNVILSKAHLTGQAVRWGRNKGGLGGSPRPLCASLADPLSSPSFGSAEPAVSGSEILQGESLLRVTPQWALPCLAATSLRLLPLPLPMCA